MKITLESLFFFGPDKKADLKSLISRPVRHIRITEHMICREIGPSWCPKLFDGSQLEIFLLCCSLLHFFALLFSFHSSTFFLKRVVYRRRLGQAAMPESAREWKLLEFEILKFMLLFYVVFVVLLWTKHLAAADFDHYSPWKKAFDSHIFLSHSNHLSNFCCCLFLVIFFSEFCAVCWFKCAQSSLAGAWSKCVIKFSFFTDNLLD